MNTYFIGWYMACPIFYKGNNPNEGQTMARVFGEIKETTIPKDTIPLNESLHIGGEFKYIVKKIWQTHK